MAVTEQRDDGQSDERKAVEQRLTRTGLSPTVERMFGALVDESRVGLAAATSAGSVGAPQASIAESKTSSAQETLPSPRSGAA